VALRGLHVASAVPGDPGDQARAGPHHAVEDAPAAAVGGPPGGLLDHPGSGRREGASQGPRARGGLDVSSGRRLDEGDRATGHGESYKDFIKRLAEEAGIENPTDEDARRQDRTRKGKTTSNGDWSPKRTERHGSPSSRTGARDWPTSRSMSWIWRPSHRGGAGVPGRRGRHGDDREEPGGSRRQSEASP